MKKNVAVFIAIVALAACGESADNNGNNHSNNDHNNEENHHHNNEVNHDHNNEENHDHNNENVTPAADACEHMEGGPEEAVTAVAVGETPPSFSETHHRYDITIPDGAGVVAIEIGEETEMSFFFNTDVTLTVTDASDATIAAEEELASVNECSDVAEGAVFDLGVGTYNLLIETTEAMVSMVPVTAEHDHEEHEGE